MREAPYTPASGDDGAGRAAAFRGGSSSAASRVDPQLTTSSATSAKYADVLAHVRAHQVEEPSEVGVEDPALDHDALRTAQAKPEAAALLMSPGLLAALAPQSVPDPAYAAPKVTTIDALAPGSTGHLRGDRCLAHGA